ncbi:cytochrome c [Mesorhizobium sp. M7A.F.Ca.CA.001.07.2.1]|uniref:cytochrome c n=3 Tax=Phyllobacteriaceae TaxID=69277 RepID=UPI000FCCA57E|nr:MULTISPECIES: cytochrome c [Mesorhizobium]RUU83071.1 cytochrome c [Mesorhizobium sp. M7A.F.Ca.MR.362.00.0.0]RVB41303.1 cytochrome c [Mesorhizobium sp. M7A.F.Ca.CA.004.05.1.1]RWN97303.1 MAG: cytochrome c [Mesorhizobium sp.]MCF6124625.1 cytochrome c [Mesorhizobium ciceri]MCQ8814287.1 cytochrome c [Mesorhizobium sp. SEMIA396]
MKFGIAFGAVVLALAGSLSLSSPQAVASSDEIVAARQASMKAMAAAAKTIAEMFGGKRAYDAASFKAAAEALSARTGPALMAEFPAGTLGAPSGAKAEIDQARPEFEALASHIGELADALAAKAETAPARITGDMRMGAMTSMDGGSLLGKRLKTTEADPAGLPAEHLLHLILQDCSSCHSKFRQKVK